MGQLTRRTDTQIHDDVRGELERDGRVRETDVGVEVDSGTVTLTGTVDDGAARLAAEEAAYRVLGIIDVVNDIRLLAPGSVARTDDDIAQAVGRALLQDAFVPEQQIQTSVSNGVVTLAGRVDLWRQYDDAARVVRNLPGVRDVRNLVRVEPERQGISPQLVRSAIEAVLDRYADHLQIVVTAGKVILRGAVTSTDERHRIEGAVRRTPGVQDVDNHLRVAS